MTLTVTKSCCTVLPGARADLRRWLSAGLHQSARFRNVAVLALGSVVKYARLTASVLTTHFILHSIMSSVMLSNGLLTFMPALSHENLIMILDKVNVQ